MKSEKTNHKSCSSPREPHGQNELSSVGERKESGPLGWTILFSLVTHAPVQDLFFSFQTSILPLTLSHCTDWKGDLVLSTVMRAS